MKKDVFLPLQVFVRSFFKQLSIGALAFLCLAISPPQVGAQFICDHLSPYGVVNTRNPSFSVSLFCVPSLDTLVVRDNNGTVVFNGGRFYFDADTYTFVMSSALNLAPGHYQWNLRDRFGNLRDRPWVNFEVRPPVNWYLDADKDGYGDANTVFPTLEIDPPTDPGNPDDVYVKNSSDCDDTDNTIHPGSTELCDDGIDQDCSGSDFACTVDNDGDGWRIETGDCDDENAAIYPGAAEICNDGVDQDCFGGDLNCSEVVCSQIADTPLVSGFSAPPNLMVVWDNSGSMDWTFSTTEAYGGLFSGYRYVFSLPDNVYSGHLSPIDRKYWRSRWHGYNRLYYNPAVDYSPWPATEKYPTLRAFADPDDQDPNLVRSHPIHNNHLRLDLDALYSLAANTGIDIVNAHYFETYGGQVYLVQLTGGNIRYYKLPEPDASTMYRGSGSPVAQEVTGNDIPPITGRSYLEERQNFANWFTFHRKRHFSAVGSFATVLSQLAGMNVGIYSINYYPIANTSIRNPVVPINVNGENQAEVLLNKMYELRIRIGAQTPLRDALKTVGEYFDDTDNIGVSFLGDSPYANAENGGACQHSVALLVTDGYWNGGRNINLGDTDKDGWSDTLADVAMHFYLKDLSDLPDKHYTTDWDTQTHQHMLTYAIVMNLSGYKNPADYPGCPENCNSIYPDYDSCNVCPDWAYPAPGDSGPVKVDDVWHATLNGRGEMYTVSEPSELTSAFLNIAASILSLGRSGSSLSVNGGNLTTNTVFYQSTYSTEDWTGDVKAYGINAVTGDVNTNYEWSASEELADDLSILGWWSSGSGRKIFTTNGRIGVPFNRSRQSTIGISTDLINYIRGDDSREGEEITDFRERNQPLGDIVSSSPIHVNNAIFVGANDGMLHAFSSATGKEIFAYVPKAVVPNLEGLAERDYVHNYFVDRTPYAKRIDENSTYLVGGLGKGGKAYYCLDISLSNLTPSSEARAASTIFQWEFPRTVDDDLGYTYSQAYIVKTTVGWVVIFGNGYESVNSKAVLYVVRLSDGHLLKKIDTQYGGSTANCNGLSSPALIDVDADGIVDYAYAGDIRGNMWKFDLRDENVSNWKVAFQDAANIPQPLFRAMNKNGHAQAIMAKPDVILSCDRGKLGYMVIFGTGKLLGKIDVSNGSTQSLYGIWDWSDEWAQNGKNAAERKAEDKYLGSFQTARDGTRTFSNLSSLAYLSDKAKKVGLVEQNQVHSDNSSVRVMSNRAVTWYSIEENSNINQYHVGWYFDLPDARERVINDVRVRNNIVLALTSVPVADPCGTQSRSYIMELDACTGGRPNSPRLDINGDKTVDQEDLVLVDDQGNPGERILVAPSGISFDSTVHLPVILTLEDSSIERKYFSTSDGTITTLDEVAERLGRYYWKEVD